MRELLIDLEVYIIQHLWTVIGTVAGVAFLLGWTVAGYLYH